MDLMTAIRGRRSCRKYKPDRVPREKIEKILQAANWAPSGRNWQQWEFLVVTGEKRDRIGKIYGEIVAARWPDAGTRTAEQESFLHWAETLGGAPVVIVALTKTDADPNTRKMNLESAAAAFQNLLLAAYAEGLGTCWMTGPLRREEELKELLGVAGDMEIVAITPLGYPAQWPSPPPRLDPDLSRKVRWIE
ncbi:MAG TPA: nitroreductase family protein [Firmicutes bacterium]|nr:nitroreductase family protein [Bacillota bacterium]